MAAARLLLREGGAAASLVVGRGIASARPALELAHAARGRVRRRRREQEPQQAAVVAPGRRQKNRVQGRPGAKLAEEGGGARALGAFAALGGGGVGSCGQG